MGNRIERFENLIAWQKARELTVEIYLLSRRGEFGKGYRLSGQIQAAAVSIMFNIAEGFERSDLGEFHQFLFTAKASCAEWRSHFTWSLASVISVFASLRSYERIPKRSAELSVN